MRYATIRLKEETSKRFWRYVAKLMHEEGGRVTADEAINELLDSEGVE